MCVDSATSAVRNDPARTINSTGHRGETMTASYVRTTNNIREKVRGLHTIINSDQQRARETTAKWGLHTINNKADEHRVARTATISFCTLYTNVEEHTELITTKFWCTLNYMAGCREETAAKIATSSDFHIMNYKERSRMCSERNDYGEFKFMFFARDYLVVIWYVIEKFICYLGNIQMDLGFIKTNCDNNGMDCAGFESCLNNTPKKILVTLSKFAQKSRVYFSDFIYA
ncbi:jg17104 [Pararge aegeria aegeria]|uniref:Jg17104 protein n=2 Tax=Pararge aegeria TaxID=116150 RepID=A0A8S4R1W5_9NEOP|nr:jg17104 [Pararge aegeria aegeria]